MNYPSCLLSFAIVAAASQPAPVSDLHVRVVDAAGAPARDVSLVIRATQDPVAPVLATMRTQADGTAIFSDAERWFAGPESRRVPALRLDFPLTSEEWLPLYGSVPHDGLTLHMPPHGSVIVHLDSIAGEPIPTGLTTVLEARNERDWIVGECSFETKGVLPSKITFDRVSLDQRLRFSLRDHQGATVSWTDLVGPKHADSSVEITVWPSTGRWGLRARASGRLLQADGRPVSNCPMLVELPIYTSEFDTCDRTYPASIGSDGGFQIALPVTENDWKWSATDPRQVPPDYADQAGRLWGFDDVRRRAFEASTVLRGCKNGDRIDVGDVKATEHDLLLRGKVQTPDGKGVAHPIVSLFDATGRPVRGRFWDSASGSFAIVSRGERANAEESLPHPWTLVVSTRGYPTRRIQVDSAGGGPVTVVVDRP